LAERLYGAPLMMMPDKAFIIESVFAAYQEGDEAKLPKWEPEREHAALAVQARRQEAGYSLTQAGVAIVPMMGSLVQRAGGLDALSGITGYNRVTAMLDAEIAAINVDRQPFEHLRGDTEVGKVIDALSAKSDAAVIAALGALSEADTNRLNELEKALKEADPLSKA